MQLERVREGELGQGSSCLSICKLHNNSPVAAATAKLQVSRCNVLPKVWAVGKRGGREGSGGMLCKGYIQALIRLWHKFNFRKGNQFPGLNLNFQLFFFTSL